MIQLRERADPSAHQFAGRVEHVDSGRADHFGSAEELVRFVERTLVEVEPPKAGAPNISPRPKSGGTRADSASRGQEKRAR